MKAIIPAAGLGTRFLPATKTLPKEMLPIVDQPTLLYIVEECINAGIHDIVLVAGRGKYAIEDFFDRSVELEETLEKQGKEHLLGKLKKIRDEVNIISIRQKEALGLGHAVWTGKPIVGKEPFAVLLGDELMIPQKGKDGVMTQLIQNYEKTGSSTVALMRVERSEISKYGIVDVKSVNETLFQINSVVEKPEPENAPSDLALPGRYFFDSSLFDHLENLKPGKNNEIQLTDGMTKLAEKGKLMGALSQDKRYDAGDKLGYLKANVELALEHPEIGEKFRAYLKALSL